MLVSLFCFSFNIVSVSGSWAEYFQTDSTTQKTGYYKMGLFNSATNEHWYSFPHDLCVLNARGSSAVEVCDARLADGVLLVFAIIFSIFSFVLLGLIVSRTLLDFRAKQAKNLAIAFFALNGMGVFGQIIFPNVSGAVYGIGFKFTIVSLIFNTALAVAAYFLVDFQGDVATLPRFGSVGRAARKENAEQVKETGDSYF
ncbi:hypothetical protein HDV01_005915 [Terramyces sp. JEL0728]|nr:hypothetical protein HDV01_005915 [Terramyces sp. JEL0728]